MVDQMVATDEQDNLPESEHAHRERWVKYKGKRVLRQDYSGLSGEDAVHALADLSERVSQRGRNDLLILTIATEFFVDKKVLSAMKNVATRNKHFTKKIAVIGVKGVQNFFLRLVNEHSKLGVRAFEDEDEALEWLIE